MIVLVKTLRKAEQAKSRRATRKREKNKKQMRRNTGACVVVETQTQRRRD